MTTSANKQPNTVDREIGKAVTKYREELGFSQSALAREMTLAGWRWTQGIVAKVESGDRAVRLAEAFSLARILETSAFSFMGGAEGLERQLSLLSAMVNKSLALEEELISKLVEWKKLNTKIASAIFNSENLKHIYEQDDLVVSYFIAQGLRTIDDLSQEVDREILTNSRQSPTYMTGGPDIDQSIAVLERVLASFREFQGDRDELDSEEG